MRTKLHELAKFAAGLIAGDFLAFWWLATHHGLPASFLGMQFTSDMVLPGMIFDAALFIILIHYGWHVGKTPLLRERTFLLAAGILFGVVALAHLVRVFAGVDIVVMGWALPLWLSYVGTGVTAYLSYMSLHLAMRTR